MLTIQDVGTEILSGNPRKFYAMVGSEYGIKLRYLRMISDAYKCEWKEAYSVNELLSFMSTKHLIPLEPMLYVVRYDEDFINSLDAKSESRISSINIVGTIVCIYEQEKQANKLDKYLPNYTVSIDSVNVRFVSKYLHQDFPSLPDRLIDLAANMSTDYNHASLICESMSHVPVESLFALSDDEIRNLFGVNTHVGDSAIRRGVASKNFSYLLNLLGCYSGDIDSFLYNILSTMIELEKIIGNSYAQSDIREYVKRWTRKDIYNMFMNTYEEIRKLRTYSQNAENSALYLISLLQFSEIPSVEAIN